MHIFTVVLSFISHKKHLSRKRFPTKVMKIADNLVGGLHLLTALGRDNVKYMYLRCDCDTPIRERGLLRSGDKTLLALLFLDGRAANIEYLE